MASIQSLGVGSGLLTVDLVDNIIGAERAATDIRIEAERGSLNARISALGTVKSALTELRSSAFQVNVASAYTATKNSVSGSGVSATTTADAAPASHTVEVGQLARAQTLATQRYDGVDAVVGTGSLTIRFGTTTYDENDDSYQGFAVSATSQEIQLDIDDTNSSLTGIRDSINGAAAGVTASIVNDGQGYRLVLTSDATGEENSMEIVVTEGATPGLSALAYNASANDPVANLSETVRAADAQATINGIAITRSSNSVTEVVEGVTFNLESLNQGSAATVTISRDTDSLVEKMEGFLEKYNDLKSLVDDLAGYDADEEIGGLLMGDASVRTVMTQLRRVMTDVVEELDATGPRSLAEMGIRSDQNDDFRLKLDKTDFLAAIEANPTGVSGLFVDRGFAADSLINYRSSFPETEPGNYAVTVSQLATRGYAEGQGGQGTSFTIDADNDTFALTVGETASGDITLDQGVYTREELAAELQRQINASAISDEGERVTVSFEDASSAFRITSNDYGSDSKVQVTAVDTNTTATFGLQLDDGIAGQGVDVVGTINGIPAKGDGRTLSLTEPGVGPGTPGVPGTPPTPDTPATSGFYEGQTSDFENGPVTINTSNRRVRRLRVDGVQTGTVQVTQGLYLTGDQLATELQTRINADSNLQSAGKSVTVTFDSDTNRFRFTSDSTGTNSTIEFTAVPSGTENTLGWTEGFGIAGTDFVAGDPGTPGTPPVPGELGPDPEGDDAYGISIEVLGGPLGDRGSVSLTNGVVSQFVGVLNNALAFDGLLNDRLGGLDAQLVDLEAEATEFDRRMALTEARLKTQFATADAMISTLNSTSDYIQQQFAALPVFNQKD